MDISSGVSKCRNVNEDSVERDSDNLGSLLISTDPPHADVISGILGSSYNVVVDDPVIEKDVAQDVTSSVRETEVVRVSPSDSAMEIEENVIVSGKKNTLVIMKHWLPSCKKGRKRKVLERSL